MSPTEKLIDKIKKLLAKANDAAVTQEEAAAFAAKAAELAAREQLELNDIDWTDRQAARPIGRYHFWPQNHDIKPTKTRVAWMEQMCHTVCQSQQCEIVLMGGNSFDIIGREGQVEIAAYLCAYLTRFALDMSWRDYGVEYRRCQAEGRVWEARGFRASWLNGFSNRVRQRLLEQREQIKLEYSQSTALVRLDTELAEVADWMKANMQTRKSKALAGRSGGHGRGYAKGRAAGEHVDVTGRATTEGDERKRIR